MSFLKETEFCRFLSPSLSFKYSIPTSASPEFPFFIMGTNLDKGNYLRKKEIRGNIPRF